jgi:Cysteine-rich CPCC
MMWRNFCYPEFAGGLNIPSLIDAQRSYARIGAIEERLLNDVRAPLETETKAPDWKPLDASIHTIERPIECESYGQYWPTDLTLLYYWRR